MSQRSSLILFCLASALVGGIVASRSTDRNRVVAQTNDGGSPATLTLTNCIRCPSQYKFASLPSGGSLEVAPAGTSGVLHAVYVTNATMEVWEGAPTSGTRVLRVPANQAFPAIDLQFTNGLFVAPYGPGGEVTVLYKLDSPISTAPIN